MSYEIVIGQDKVFGNNPLFKDFNPTVDITVDFKNRNIYEMFMNKIFFDYRQQVMKNITRLQINNHILLKLTDKHPELSEEIVKIVENLNGEELKEEFFNKILPAPII